MDQIGLSSAVEQLYSGDPADFVATRKQLATRFRAQGDKDLARIVSSLRRPSAAAAAINALARQHDPAAIPQLEQLGAKMRAAQAQLDAEKLKALSAQRSSVIAELVRRAEQFGPTTAGVQEQLTQSFTAALASESAQEAVCSGQLVTALSYSGFGEVEVADAVAIPLQELHRARMDDLAQREAQRSQKPTRTPSHSIDASADAQIDEPPTAASERSSDAGDRISDTGQRPEAAGSPDTARALYEQAVVLEQQALQAVQDARAFLAAAQEHATVATHLRRSAQDRLAASEQKVRP